MLGQALPQGQQLGFQAFTSPRYDFDAAFENAAAPKATQQQQAPPPQPVPQPPQHQEDHHHYHQQQQHQHYQATETAAAAAADVSQSLHPHNPPADADPYITECPDVSPIPAERTENITAFGTSFADLGAVHAPPAFPDAAPPPLPCETNGNAAAGTADGGVDVTAPVPADVAAPAAATDTAQEAAPLGSAAAVDAEAAAAAAAAAASEAASVKAREEERRNVLIARGRTALQSWRDAEHSLPQPLQEAVVHVAAEAAGGGDGTQEQQAGWVREGASAASTEVARLQDEMAAVEKRAALVRFIFFIFKKNALRHATSTSLTHTQAEQMLEHKAGVASSLAAEVAAMKDLLEKAQLGTVGASEDNAAPKQAAVDEAAAAAAAEAQANAQAEVAKAEREAEKWRTLYQVCARHITTSWL